MRSTENRLVEGPGQETLAAASPRRPRRVPQTGDIPAVPGEFHPHCLLHKAEWLPYPGISKGLEGFMELLGIMGAAFEIFL